MLAGGLWEGRTQVPSVEQRGAIEKSITPRCSFFKIESRTHKGPIQTHFFKSSFDQPPMKMEKGHKRVETIALLQFGFSGFILSALLPYQTNTIPEISQAIAM